MKIELSISQSTSPGTVRTKILAILPALIPSSIILVVEPLMHLAGLGKIEFRMRLENLWIHESDLEWTDLVVFCRNTEPAYNNILDRVLSLKKPYIYELDDNFFEVPLEIPDGKYHRAPERIAQLEKYIINASLVRVYSSPLEANVRKYTSRVKVVKAPVNLISIPAVPSKRKSQRLKIVFPTSRTISDDLSQIFVKDIIRVINDFGNNIEVHFWGFVPEELKKLPPVKFHRFIPNYQKYMRKMYRQGYDIGLAPMKRDIFYNSKTNNKFREYGACWIAGIYSNSEVYTNCVEDGVTGVLVSNAEGEWYKAVVRMMKDVKLRHSIQMQARTVVEKEFSLGIFSDLLLNDVNFILQECFEEERAKIDSVQKSNNVQPANNLESKNLLLKLFALIRSRIDKVRRLLNNYGLLSAYRLMLNEVGRYAQYFWFSCKIKQIDLYNLIAHSSNTPRKNR